MLDLTRPPTPLEVQQARERLRLTQAQFARLLGFTRPATVSDWETGAAVPTLTYARMQELLADAQAPAHEMDRHRRDREYTAAMLSLIKSDAQDIAASAKRQLDKLEVAERFLTGSVSPAPVSLAAETEESQALRPDAAAGRAKSRRRQGHH